MPNLFQTGDFTLRSGVKSKWKIEMDALTTEDWEGLAQMASEILSPFQSAMGVPRGGIPLALAMDKFASGNLAHPVLICEDVCTTGGSIHRFKDNIDKELGDFKPAAGYIGVCAFARGNWPAWVTPLFVFNIHRTMKTQTRL